MSKHLLNKHRTLQSTLQGILSRKRKNVDAPPVVLGSDGSEESSRVEAMTDDEHLGKVVEEVEESGAENSSEEQETTLLISLMNIVEFMKNKLESENDKKVITLVRNILNKYITNDFELTEKELLVLIVDHIKDETN